MGYSKLSQDNDPALEFLLSLLHRKEIQWGVGSGRRRGREGEKREGRQARGQQRRGRKEEASYSIIREHLSGWMFKT